MNTYIYNIDKNRLIFVCTDANQTNG